MGNHNNFDNSNIETDNDNFDNCIKGTENIYDNNELKNAIRTWAMSHNITHNACNALLKILRQHTSQLTYKCANIVRNSKINTCFENIWRKLFYFSLNNVIKKMLLKDINEYINLLINIDGLPIAKLSQAALWTILCSNIVNNAIYLISIAYILIYLISAYLDIQNLKIVLLFCNLLLMI